MKYEKLFSSMKIGNVEIKNRIAMAPMMMGFGTFDGKATENLMKYYEERAKGGVGLIFTEITRVNDKTGASAFNQLSVSNDCNIESLRDFANRIHKHNCKLFIQLHHPGRQNIGLMVKTIPLCIKLNKTFKGFSKLLWKIAPKIGPFMVRKKIVFSSVAPSKVVPSYFSGGKVRALKHKEITELIDNFASGAERVKKAGCDGIMLHASHGYLIQQFLSPYTNKRKDEFGGNLENRMKFLLDIINKIREKCGNFPIVVRLSLDEMYSKIGFPERGYNIEEGIVMAKTLEKAGIDAIDVSCASYDTFNYWLEPPSFELGWRAYLAKAVKESVKIPVIAANLIRSAEQAERQLKEEVQDFVSLGRPHLADPYWVNKVYDGKENEVKRCICCLYCFESMQLNAYHGKHGGCAVNPRLGFEYKEIIKDGGGRVVIIVGSGPSGLTVAEVLGKRGFKPIVLEKNSVIGGQVALASNAECKKRIGWCIDDLKFAAEKNGADIRTSTNATKQLIDFLNPYAVVIATGSNPILPKNIKGIDKPHVYLSTEVFKGKINFENKKIAIIGSGMTGLDTASILIEKNNKLTIVEMAKNVAPGMWMQHVDDILPKLKEKGADILTSSKLVSVENDHIVIESTKIKKRRKIEADIVIIAIGVMSDNKLWNELKNTINKLFIVGDALKAGRIAAATSSAFEVAMKIV